MDVKSESLSSGSHRSPCSASGVPSPSTESGCAKLSSETSAEIDIEDTVAYQTLSKQHSTLQSKCKSVKKQLALVRLQLQSKDDSLQSKQALCRYQENQINKISATLTPFAFFDVGMNVSEGVDCLACVFRCQRAEFRETHEADLKTLRKQLSEKTALQAALQKEMESITASLEAENCIASVRQSKIEQISIDRGVLFQTNKEFAARERRLTEQLKSERAEVRLSLNKLSAPLNEFDFFKTGSMSLVQGVQRLAEELKKAKTLRTTTKRLSPPKKGEYIIEKAVRCTDTYIERRGVRLCEVGRIRIDEEKENRVEIEVVTPSSLSNYMVIQHELPMLSCAELSTNEKNLSIRWRCTEMDAMVKQKGFLLTVFFSRSDDFRAFRQLLFQRLISSNTSSSFPVI